MRNHGHSPTGANLPDVLRPGRPVRVRGTTWQVKAVRAGDDCLAVDLTSIEGGWRPRTLLHPFDRFVAIGQVERSRRVSRRRWTAALRGLIDECADWNMPRSAVTARIDVLPYQLEPLLAVLRGSASRLLIADAVGLGKTIEAGLILAELCQRGLARRSLVITPAGLRHQWIDELAQRFGMASTLADAAWLARRTHEVPMAVNPWTLPGCYVTSIDFLKQPEVVTAARELRWDLVVVDEAHLAARGTDRGAAIHDLASRAQWVVLLSATPHDGAPDRFAALCRAGHVGAASDSLLVFRRLRPAGDAEGLAPRTRFLTLSPSTAEAHAHRLLARYAERVWDSAETSASGGARLAMTVLLKRAFSSMHALERSARRRLHLLATGPKGPTQQQLPLASDEPGSLGDEEPDAVLGASGLPNEAHERAWLGAIAESARFASRHDHKLAVVRRLLCRTDEPLLLFTEYRDTLAWIARTIERLAPIEVLHGGLAEHERADAVDRFSSGQARVLLATDAAALGLNLQQRCRLVVNLEVPWNPNRVAQRVGRLARIGQRRRVHALVLVAGGTGEERVRDVFDSRQNSIAAGLGAMTKDATVDPVVIGATVLDRQLPGGEHPQAAMTDGPSPVHAVPGDALRPAGSIVEADARRCACVILARRRVAPASLVAAQLARRSPWVTHLSLRGNEAPELGARAIHGLAMLRARLVDNGGYPWASTLMLIGLPPPRPVPRDRRRAWREWIDAVRPELEREACRHLEPWVEKTRASIETFLQRAGDRSKAIDRRVRDERRRSPYQRALFLPAGHDTAATGVDRSHAPPDWVQCAQVMTLECETVLGASIILRPSSCKTPDSLVRRQAGES